MNNVSFCKKVALYAGALMLKNGAETFRVEEVMKYIMYSSGYQNVESFVTPTGIFLCVSDEESSGTYIKRIESRSINLAKIDAINTISRQLSKGEITLIQAYETFQQIEKQSSYSKIVKIAAASITAAFFCLLFQGNGIDFIVTFFVTLIMQGVLTLLNPFQPSFFLTNLIGGGLAAFLSSMALYVQIPIHLDLVIIGTIMTLVPGVAITNSIRDTFHGDLISGVARMAEALFIAMAIAAGVGIVLNFFVV